MTVKLVVLYAQPDDPDAFERHYTEQHVPLVNKVPGLQRFEAGRLVAAADGGELAFSRIAELHFADQEALQAGLGSEEGRQTSADYAAIAPPGSRLFISVVDD